MYKIPVTIVLMSFLCNLKNSVVKLYYKVGRCNLHQIENIRGIKHKMKIKKKMLNTNANAVDKWLNLLHIIQMATKGRTTHQKVRRYLK